MPRKKYDAMVAGYLCVDMAPSFKPGRKVPLSRLLQPGKLTEVGNLTITLGGAVANTGLAMQAFGNRVVLNGLAGEDRLGELAWGILKKYGLRAGIQGIASAPTAYSIVLAPPGTDRIFLESPGCNAVFTASHVNYKNAAQCRLFHFGYPPLMKCLYHNKGKELATIFKRVKKHATATALDMSMPDPDSGAGQADWEAILARVLPAVDIFMPSIEEMVFMLAPGKYARLNRSRDMIRAIPEELFSALGEKVVNMGAKIVLLKAGHRGIYIRTGDIKALTDTTALKLAEDNWSSRELWIPCFRAEREKIINASGAGDAAVAAFLTAVLRGTTIEMAGRYAALAGRNNLYGSDALSGLTDWGKMTRALKVKNQKAITSPGSKQFRFCPQTYVYKARQKI